MSLVLKDGRPLLLTPQLRQAYALVLLELWQFGGYSTEELAPWQG